MKLTNYQHACFTVEKDGKTLVVDPGNLPSDFRADELNDVVAVVITHSHPDHFDETALRSIAAKNPDCLFVGPADVISQIDDLSNQAALPGQTTETGPFKLDFFGGEHAEIHSDIPIIDNVGVMINSQVYYPGDSFTLPGVPIDTLALPVAAPWMKISQSIDFLLAAKPSRLAFPTHDAILSKEGQSIVDRLLTNASEKASLTYRRLDTPLDIN